MPRVFARTVFRWMAWRRPLSCLHQQLINRVPRHRSSPVLARSYSMEDTCLVKPGESIRPDITVDQAHIMVERLYGVKITTIKELISFDDRNFHIVINETHVNPHLGSASPQGYVFKILNSLDSRRQHVDAQHEAQRRLRHHDICCPSAVMNLKGDEFTLETLPNSDNGLETSPKHYVRLLSYVPGKILDKIQPTSALLRSVGQLVGQVRHALEGWSHPALRGYKYVWSLPSLIEAKTFLYALKDQAKIDFVGEVIDTFERDVLSKQSSFEKGVIHGDINEMNILVVPTEGGEGGDYKLSGLIDLGDMMDSCPLYDLAINIAYMIMCNKHMEPLAVGYHVIQGYQTEASLNDAEWRALKMCIMARLCQSLVNGYYNHSQSPDNDYLKKTLEDAWKYMNVIWKIPDERIISVWRDKDMKHINGL